MFVVLCGDHTKFREYQGNFPMWGDDQMTWGS